MATAQELRDRARTLRAQADDQATTEVALAFRARAAWLDRQADNLDEKHKAGGLPPNAS